MIHVYTQMLWPEEDLGDRTRQTVTRSENVRLYDLPFITWRNNSSADCCWAFRPCLRCRSGVPRNSLTQAWGLMLGQGGLLDAACFCLTLHHPAHCHTFWEDFNIWLVSTTEQREQILNINKHKEENWETTCHYMKGLIKEQDCQKVRRMHILLRTFSDLVSLSQTHQA